MSAEQNKTTAADWLSLTEDDSSWLKAIELDESLHQTSDADMDWLLPLDALQDTPPTVSITGTTASLAVPPQPPHNAPPSLDNLDDLDNLFVNESSEQSVPTWDTLEEFAQSSLYEENNYSLDELEAWEQEALQATQDPAYSDWTEVPSSVSEMALREAQEQMAWDVKDDYNSSADTETQDFANTYALYEEPEQFQPDEDKVPETAQTIYSFSEDIGHHPSEMTEPNNEAQPQINQVFAEIISEARPDGKVGEFNFVEDDFADFQQSEFDLAHLNQENQEDSSFALSPPPVSYLDNSELDTSNINIDLDIDLEEFRNSAASPPLHEIFSANSLPPLPTPKTSDMDSSPSMGDKWANPAKQMSTGLNPDRRPFEAAPPDLITNVAPRKAKSDFDIFDLDENTDWSGLLEEDTAVNKDDRPPAPIPVAPRPAQPKVSAPPPLPNTKKTIQPPTPILYQEVRQFQELLDDSNLSAVNLDDAVRPLADPLAEDVPLHSREVSGAQKVKASQPPVKLPPLPALPWGAIAKYGGIAVGAIAVLWLGGTVFNRPLTELGLRTGLWKDAKGKDLSRIVLNDANLENANLSHANLDGARLQNANLKGATFVEARLNGVSLSGANLRGARLNRASIVFSNLARADLSLVDLSEADLTRANLTGAKLNGANLQGTKIGKLGTAEATKFDREALLLWQALNEPAVGRNMSRSNFLGFRFNQADLRRANFTNSNLSFATFENAKLNGANFTGAILNNTDFSGADLSGTFLGDASWDRDKPPQSDAKTVCPNGKLGPCRF